MKKKVALITGGSRGIGLGIAKTLAQNGYHLAINGQRNLAEVQHVINELKSYGGDVIYCQGNIASVADRTQIIDQINNHFGYINVLVNNAGVAPKVRKDLLEINEDAYEWLLKINLQGPFFLSQSVANWMIQLRQDDPDFNACLVNITSISANVASVNRGEYCISKAGMSMMSQLYAVRLSEFQIPVYEIRPGIIETDMTEGVKAKYNDLIQNGLTLDKRLGMPADVGKVVSLLANGGLPYGTGQVITLDGGLHVRRL